MLVNKLRIVAIAMLVAALAPWLFWATFESSHFASKKDELFLWLLPHTAPSFALGLAILIDTLLTESKRRVHALGRWPLVVVVGLAIAAMLTPIILMHREHVAAMSTDVEPGQIAGFALLDSKLVEFIAASVQMLFDGVTMGLLVKVALAE